MTVALEEFTEWRDTVEVRLDRLESVTDEHTKQYNHNGRLLVSMNERLGKLESESRAQRGMLQALHLTQNEHTATLREHTATLKDHTERLERLDTRVQKLETGQEKVLAGVQAILGLLQPANGIGG
jgi:chromosome segregation ATPase